MENTRKENVRTVLSIRAFLLEREEANAHPVEASRQPGFQVAHTEGARVPVWVGMGE